MSALTRDDNDLVNLGIAENYGTRKAVLIPIVLLYWSIVRRHRLLIGLIFVGALVAGVLVTLLSTPKFLATTRIEIDREQLNITSVETLQSPEANASTEFYATQYALLRSRSLARSVARVLRLDRNEVFLADHVVDDDAIAINGVGDRRRKREELIVTALLRSVTVSPIRQSSLVDVSFESTSPQLSQQIANTWAEQFIRQGLDRRFAATADARTFLETRLEELRRRLNASERELVQYAETNQIVRLSETESTDGKTRTTGTLNSATISAISEALIEASSDRIEAEAAFVGARSGRASNATVQSLSIGELRQRRAELAAQYAQLMERFEPSYPEARALQMQIDNLDASISREERRVVDSLETSYVAATRREAELRARLDSATGNLNRENSAFIQYNVLQREVDTNRQLYDALLQRYKEIGVAGVGSNNVSVVDVADLPDRPSSPNVLLNIALAVILGTMLAAATVMILENLDEGIRDPAQVTDELGLPLLGVIPTNGDGTDVQLLLADSKSIISEAYMTVRTKLALSTSHGIPRSLSVCSSGPSEGKSTSALALAVMIARTGKRVILLDVDLRRPMLGHYLGIPTGNGVSSILAGADDWRSMIFSSPYPNLSVIPAGKVPPSASELLSSERLTRFINELLVDFDHVVVDGPPMLDLSDAALIANAVEASVYVIESRKTRLRAAKTAIGRLRDSRAHLVGAVLTKYNTEDGVSYGYGYGYGYGSDKVPN